MSIKTRLARIEREAAGTEPLTVFLMTFPAEPNDEAGSSYRTAVIIGGPGRIEYLKPKDGEGMDHFEQRVRETSLRLHNTGTQKR